MAKLPSSFRQRNRTTRGFRNQYSKLPRPIQKLCKSCCIKFNEDPRHPALRLHPLIDRDNSSHRDSSFSVSINMQYRAIFVVQNGINVWYWIGTHAEYDTFTGG